jgi:hypothetical protein
MGMLLEAMGLWHVTPLDRLHKTPLVSTPMIRTERKSNGEHA